MLRKTIIILLLLLPIVCFSQSKLKGRFISNHYTRWVYNSKTEQDDQLGPIETCLTIRFSENSVSIMQARGFQQQNYKVVSVSLRAKRTLDSTLRVKEFVYKLKDTHGHPTLLLASVIVNGVDFKFDFFKGDTIRATYTNSNKL